MKKFTGLLLCTSIALFSVLFLSGCKNAKYYHDELKELYATVSVAETSETENLTQSSETALAETESSVSASTEEKSIYQQCLESFTTEKAWLGNEYIYDTTVYDIDNDGADELLILYYGVARGADLHVYKMYENSFVYCGCITCIMCKLNENIKDFPIHDAEFYDKIDIKKYKYNGEEYNILLFSYGAYAAKYNHIVALDIDENNEIQEIPILSWGIDIKAGAKGEEIVPHNYFYLTADGEKEISDEDVQYYLSYIN